ncbi:hypothetical protein LCGC14_1769120 [marine sediment metagenome]|uniref:Uncharacterized protein n=1 Tax=marine sediment metagenome TaxID=412755 RepID=A0A0F9GYU5_9ZZZZ
MSYLIDAVMVTREVFLLGYVVITSPMGLIAGALLLGSSEY